MPAHEKKPQLLMVWPTGGDARVEMPIAPVGYVIRTYRPGDEESFLGLMAEGDFDPWDEAKLQFNMGKVIPEGWFFAVQEHTGVICGTAMCLHNYKDTTPFTGELGWLACAADHRGRGLGACLTAHVTARFLAAGYSLIQLRTEYYRPAAIRIYLKAGYVPHIETEDVHALWREVCEQIGWEFTPEQWSALVEARHG